MAYIRITDEKHKLIKDLAKKERRSMKSILERALENFFKAKKVLEN